MAEKQFVHTPMSSVRLKTQTRGCKTGLARSTSLTTPDFCPRIEVPFKLKSDVTQSSQMRGHNSIEDRSIIRLNTLITYNHILFFRVVIVLVGCVHLGSGFVGSRCCSRCTLLLGGNRTTVQLVLVCQSRLRHMYVCLGWEMVDLLVSETQHSRLSAGICIECVLLYTQHYLDVDNGHMEGHMQLSYHTMPTFSPSIWRLSCKSSTGCDISSSRHLAISPSRHLDVSTSQRAQVTSDKWCRVFSMSGDCRPRTNV